MCCSGKMIRRYEFAASSFLSVTTQKYNISGSAQCGLAGTMYFNAVPSIIIVENIYSFYTSFLFVPSVVYRSSVYFVWFSDCTNETVSRYNFPGGRPGDKRQSQISWIPFLVVTKLEDYIWPISFVGDLFLLPLTQNTRTGVLTC